MAGRPSHPARTAQANFGALLRAHRRRLPLTQEQLAERAGLSERTLRNLEAGRIRLPYPDTIRRLADALNLTGEERQDFEAAARQATIGSTAAAESRSDPLGPAPYQLPPDVADFTGRSEQVAVVRELLCGTAAVRPATVVVSAVAGKAGVGKTALAVHVAHQLRRRRSPTGSCTSTCAAPSRPAEPAEVLGRFLRALGPGRRHRSPPSWTSGRSCTGRAGRPAGAGGAGRRGRRGPGPPAAAGHARLRGAGHQPGPADRAGGGAAARSGGAASRARPSSCWPGSSGPIGWPPKPRRPPAHRRLLRPPAAGRPYRRGPAGRPAALAARPGWSPGWPTNARRLTSWPPATWRCGPASP